MDIQFCKLYLLIPEVGIVEVVNYWQLPFTIPVLAGNPERPIEDWHHCSGDGKLWFLFTDTKTQANVSVEFIDPDGLSRGKYTKTLLTNQSWPTHNLEFDKVGIWKLKGTLNGIAETWDALNVIDVEVPPPPPPPPPDAIQDILCWNPYTKLFQANYIDVEPGADIGVKFTLENILSYTYTFRPIVKLKNAAGGSQSFTGADVVLNPGDKHTFECKKTGGWTIEGLASAEIYIYVITQYGGVGGPQWTLLGVPIANITSSAPPVTPPPPGNFGLQVTSYQRV